METLLPWLKSLHVLAVIAWMAGMLYLPRLFVYHADAETGSVQSETFKIMERRLYRGITTPAMIATWVFGLSMLAIDPAIWWGAWAWVKAATVLVLTGVHGFYGRLLRDFLADRNTKSHRFYRGINEIPFVLAIVIVIMVIVKPF